MVLELCCNAVGPEDVTAGRGGYCFGSLSFPPTRKDYRMEKKEEKQKETSSEGSLSGILPFSVQLSYTAKLVALVPRDRSAPREWQGDVSVHR